MNTIQRIILLVVTGMPAGYAAEPLKNNPFVRPNGLEERVRRESGQVVERLVLKATLPGPVAMVAVNDEVLRVGEHIGRYRLVEVTEGGAVFVRDDGTWLTLAVYEPDRDGKNDED